MSFTSGPYAAQSRVVLDNEAALIPANTLASYEPKANEFLEFCKILYGVPNTRFHRSGIPYETVTEEKVFSFLFYQVIFSYSN